MIYCDSIPPRRDKPPLAQLVRASSLYLEGPTFESWRADKCILNNVNINISQTMPLLEIIFNVLVIGLLFVYWAVAFIILYHLTRFGVGVQPKRFAAIFMLGSLVLSSIAIILFTKLEIGVFLTRISQ